MAWWQDRGSAQRSAGQGAYTGCPIPGTDFPLLRPVERWRPDVGTRGQRGHGGRDGLVGLGKGRPRGSWVFLLRITQASIGQRDTWCHHTGSGLLSSGWEVLPGGADVRMLSKGEPRNHPRRVHGWDCHFHRWTVFVDKRKSTGSSPVSPSLTQKAKVQLQAPTQTPHPRRINK